MRLLPEVTKKPKLVRTVSLTSKHIWNEVVSAENRALFKNIKRKKPAPTLPLPLADYRKADHRKVDYHRLPAYA